MPLTMQAKLLRFMQEKTVRPIGGETETAIDVRVISASHKDLLRLANRGEFRADLYHRVAVIRLDVPPLRSRIGDLDVLSGFLGERLEKEAGLSPMHLSDGAMKILQSHTWPGNVRELEAVLARARLAATGPVVRQHDIERALLVTPAGDSRPRGRTLECEMILTALQEAEGNIPRAAALIGWTRQKLHRRMQALGLRPPG
jgi:two-component system NtrC family response regulator